LISNKVNIWREIEADGAGIVAEDNLQGVCELLQTYMGLSEENKFEMRGRARACFAQRFEISKAAETLQNILADLTGVNSLEVDSTGRKARNRMLTRVS